MVKLRSGDSWVPAPVYARSLGSLSINLLVRSIERALVFQSEVLQALIVYSDPDFAVVRGCGAEWMLHADHTYLRHPLHALLSGEGRRGLGMELRLHGCDPDRAQAAAMRLGFRVLAPATDTGHGLREAYLVDADDYVWVPDVHSDLTSSASRAEGAAAASEPRA